VARDRRAVTAVVAIIAALQMAAIAVFDVAARGLPLNDDWVYAEPARRLATGHGLHLFPEVAVPAIPQLLLGAAAWAMRPSPALLRLQTLAFACAAVLLVGLLSVRLGAPRAWAALAGAALAAYPVFAGVSATFMTEPLYLALLLAAAWRGIVWLEGGRPDLGLPILVLLAALDRQHAVGIPVALSIAWAMGSRRRSRGGLLMLAACWVAVAGGLLVPLVTHLATPRMGFRIATAGHSTLQLLEPAAAYTPRLVGLLALPFGLPLARVAWGDRPPPAALVIGIVAAALGLVSLLFPDGTRGTYLTAAGLGPVTLAGDKPQLLGIVWPVLKVASVGAFSALVAAAYRRREGLTFSAPIVLLLVLAATQAAPMLTFSVYDRYFLPVLALLLPLVALLPGRSAPRFSDGAWAATALVVLCGVFIAGQQDYLAWESARDQLALQVMKQDPTSVFFGGYETYGTYTLAPRFEAGHYGGPTGPELPSFVGPPAPEVVLRIAGPGDPRPGTAYSSLAPGRVVLECPRGSCPAGLGH
jgi:hypothetical protein